MSDEKSSSPEGDDVEEVPAGGAGADSGSAETVRIDPDDEAEIPNRSEANDEAGVGTRPPSRDPRGTELP
ncbi:hypothetical protein [Microbacterium tumbae]